MDYSNYSYTRLIEKHFDNNLTPTELEQFTKLMNDPLFVQEVTFHKELNNTLENFMSEKKLRNQLDLVHEELMNDNPNETDAQKTHQIRRTWYYFAAAFAGLLLVSSILFYTVGKTPDTQNIFNEHYTAYAIIDGERGNSQNPDIFSMALTLYKNKDYIHASQLFKQITDTCAGNLEAQFYLGIAFIETNKIAEAKTQFEKIIATKSPVFLAPARWYHALCQLKSNNINEAQKEFTLLSTEETSYKLESEKILKKLK